MKKKSNVSFIVVVLLGGLLATMTETIMNNSLTTIMKELHVSESTAQWLSTGYIMAAGIVMPVAVYLIHRFKLRQLFPTSLAIFLAGTIIGSLAPNFYILLLGRIIQAVSVGIIMPLVQNLMVLLFPPEKRGFALGISGFVIVLGPAIGPTLSGWIVGRWSWRMLFIFLLPITVIILLLALIFTKNVTQQEDDKLDLPSVLASSVGLGLILFSCSHIGNAAAIDLTAIITMVLGLIVTGFFVARQLKLDQPLLEMRVFKAPSFTKATILASITSIAMLGVELLLPLYLQNVRGVSALASGLIMLPGALVMVVLSPLAGNWYDRFGIRPLAFGGFTIMLLTSIPMIWFNEKTSLVWIAVLYALRMSGVGLAMMQLNTAGVNALPERYSIHGNTVTATVRQVASSLGTSLLVTIAAVFASQAKAGGTAQRASLRIGYSWSFAVIVFILLICLAMTFTLKNKTTPEIK